MNEQPNKIFASALPGVAAPVIGDQDSESSAAYIARKEEMIREISCWKGVTVHQHQFGGVEFRLGRRELGHLHRAFADLAFPRAIRDELIESGRARPHHVLPDSGWITVPMGNSAETANVTELFRKNYERTVKTNHTADADLEVPFFY